MSMFKEIAEGVGDFLLADAMEGNDDVTVVRKAAGKLQSIASKAKKSIFTYPVIVSEGVASSDIDLTFRIIKHLEGQYGLFTMIAMGVNPTANAADSHNIDQYLGSMYSAESLSVGMESDAYTHMPAINANMRKYNYSRATLATLSGLESDGKGGGGGNSPMRAELKASWTDKVKSLKPTIVNAKIRTGEDKDSTVTIPIAIKCVPHFITPIESESIFESIKENRPVRMIVKLLSGEIGLIKDIILQLGKISKDTALYERVGRHPWFRALRERRANRRFNGLLSLIEPLKRMIKLKPDILPITTLIVTKEEIESGLSNTWSKIKKHTEKIKDDLMLLALVVVDTNAEIVEIDYLGLTSNDVFRAEDIGKSDKKDDKDSANLLEKLIRRV